MGIYLCYFKELRYPGHSSEKLLVNIQTFFTLSLLHVKVFFCLVKKPEFNQFSKNSCKILGTNRPKAKKSLKAEVILEGLTKQVDNAFVISSKEPDGVFEEEHEGCIDDSISQLVGIDLWEGNQPRHLSCSAASSLRFVDTEKQSLCVRTLSV